VWKELKATPKHFVLYGGTALALRFGHRVSEDFDFFTNATFEPQDLLERISYLRDGKVTLLRENTLTVVLDRHGPVSVSFFGGLGFARVSSPDIANDNGVQPYWKTASVCRRLLLPPRPSMATNLNPNDTPRVKLLRGRGSAQTPRLDAKCIAERSGGRKIR
jgi:hypothetical protein